MTTNDSKAQYSTFILTGIPGLETQQIWISIPFFSIYILALLGNSILLYILQAYTEFHEPMYYFLSMLTVTDIVLTTSIVPKTLWIFWFNAGEIHLDSCLTQMFFLHSFSVVESGILVAMAFDRYVAICNPLRYFMILTGPVIAKAGLFILFKATLAFLPHLVIMKQLPYCQANLIHHTYCEFMAVVKQACRDTSVLRAYSLSVALLTGGLDFICVIFSYALILKAVSSHSNTKGGLKALGTCASHFFIMLIFYTTSIFSFLTHRFGHAVAPEIHIIMANMYPLVPPFINPIVYGLRTKQIRDKLLQMLSCKAVR
ncbi:olfactory receptor 52N4-like [Pleurodeles waltl]|uniref:olfactory receptor 52N4-like n=1 Tax=Pleurodeles waltl TaxID=8319 RepID=UPI003709BF0B